MISGFSFINMLRRIFCVCFLHSCDCFFVIKFLVVKKVFLLGIFAALLFLFLGHFYLWDHFSEVRQ